MNNLTVGSIRADHEGCDFAWDILSSGVDRDAAGVGSGMAGDDHQLGGVGGIGCAKGMGIPCDAGVYFVVRRVHGELIHRSLRHPFVNGHLGGGLVSGPNDKVSVRIAGGLLPSGNSRRRHSRACGDRG